MGAIKVICAEVFMIPFNKPYLQGQELGYMTQAIKAGKLSGDGEFTKKCHAFFEQRYGFGKSLLTTSCTDALELCALLLNIQPGDEVIVPAFTFVSSANAFALRGAKLVFVDSQTANPNMDLDHLESLITPKTKAIVLVHYAGIASDMDRVMALSEHYQVPIVEDAAQAIDSFYKDKPLGTFGAVAAFSFHETKNIVCGEGGMLCIHVDQPQYMQRAEIMREKGTNRGAFFRGEVDKYGWVDVGSSFLPSDILAAFLLAQLEHLDAIQNRRKAIWAKYDAALRTPLESKGIQMPFIPAWASNNAHMYYMVLPNLATRTHYITKMKQDGVSASFHYLSLNSSPYSQKHGYQGINTPNSDRYSDCLVRLPLYAGLSDPEVDHVIDKTLQHLQ